LLKSTAQFPAQKNFGSGVIVRPYVRPSVQTLDERDESSKAVQGGRGRRISTFLGWKSRGAFGKPTFFMAENRTTIVAFELKGQINQNFDIFYFNPIYLLCVD